MKNNEDGLEYASFENMVKLKPEALKKSRVKKHRIITSEKEFDDLKTDWDLLCDRIDSTVFQLYDWNRTWWDHFGAFGELQIFVLYDGETLVGVAPLFFDRTAIAGMKSYTRLRMIGSEISTTEKGPLLGFRSYSDYLQFLVEKNYIKSFFEHLSYFLNNEVYFDELIIEEVPEHSSTLSILNSDFSSNGYAISISNASRSYNVLPEASWDDYLKHLTSKERNNVKRCQKRNESGNKSLFCVDKLELNGEVKSTLQWFIEIHQKQWNNKGVPGSFAEISMHRFFMDVSQKLYKSGHLEIKTIQPNGKFGLEHCLAIDINLVFKDRMYGQHRAMDIESPFFSKSPGKVLLIDNIKDAVQSHRTFDFLLGEEKYKKRLATHTNQNKTIRISVSAGHRKWIGQILSVLHRIYKTVTNEIVRLQVIKNVNKSELAITRYFRYLFERINRRF